MTLAPPGASDSIEDSPDGYRIFRMRIPNVYHTYVHDRVPAWKKPFWHLIDQRNPFSRKALDEVISEFRPDVVNTHNLQGMGYNLWALLGKANLPVLVTLHDPSVVCIRSSMFRNGETCTRLCRSCDLSRRVKKSYLESIEKVTFASPSRALLSILGRYLPPNCVEARHLPNPLGFKRKQLTARKHDCVELLYVGQISTHKGVEFLLSVLEEMKPEGRFRLTLLGRGSLLDPLRTRFSGKEWVRFEGFVAPEKVSGQMAESDVLLIPSLWVENAPLVAMEAIGLGLPMITSSKGGLPELVEHEVTGLILEAGNRVEWKEALSNLAGNREMITKWKGNALHRRREFDVDLLGERYLALVRRTIEGRRQHIPG